MADTDTGKSRRREIDILIRSRFPIIYVVSWEERRVMETVAEIASSMGKKVFVWSCLSGLAPMDATAKKQAPPSRDPVVALGEASAHKEAALFVFKDFHPFLARNNTTVIRALREIAQEFTSSFKTIIIVGPLLNLPPELEKEVTVVDFSLPGRPELESLLRRAAKETSGNPKLAVDLSDAAREELLNAVHGLTLAEAESVFAKSLVVHGRLGREQIPDILAEKKQIIRKSGLLDYCEPDVSLDDVGGLEVLKAWLAKRRLAFSERARGYGLMPPKGALLLGVQGCGKSLCAKAVSALWHMPLLRLDIGRIFNSLVGASEENIRRAISIAEGVAPCILWVDEIDKAFGALSGSSTDSGTTQRVLGCLLTWLAEKCSPVFVLATANNVSILPPELLRKGRFDEIFFVDLPAARERENIFAIHIRRRGREPGRFRLAELAAASEGFSGAEIEQALISAMFDAFYDDGREVAPGDVLRALSETVPLSRTMGESIDSLREWCATRARPASSPRAESGIFGGLPPIDIEVEEERL